ncbi:MAG: short-chain dehydrogenase [marine bacterium B5-7]|nr:MAG: short-chain dehydrogenase [marine bacterium B5-7]
MTTYAISGAARGIGLELTQQLLARGDRVIGLCRQTSNALTKSGADVIEGVDVTSDDSMQHIGELISHSSDRKPIDVLVNNAGILSRENLDNLDFDAMRRQFDVNSLGPLRLTTTLLPYLASNARVAIITSRMGSIADNGSGGYYGYRASKTAVNSIAMSLARDLESRGIAVGLLHPGMVATDMTSHNGIPVAESAAGLIQRLDELSLENTGTWWHANGEVLPW